MTNNNYNYIYKDEKELFNLDIDNYMLYNCYIGSGSKFYKTISYRQLLLNILSLIYQTFGMNELISMSNYPSYFENDKYHEDLHFCFDIEKLNERQCLNEILELVKYNDYTISFELIKKNTSQLDINRIYYQYPKYSQNQEINYMNLDNNNMLEDINLKNECLM
jgi:hypothetical protein